MDPLTQAASQFGVTTQPRFFGGSAGNPMQSLVNRYQVELERQKTVNDAMEMQAKSVALERQQKASDLDTLQLDHTKDQLKDRETAFAVLEALSDRDPTDPSFITDLQRAAHRQPRLLSVPEFKTAIDTAITTQHNSNTLERQTEDNTMRAQQTVLGRRLKELEDRKKFIEEDKDSTFFTTEKDGSRKPMPQTAKELDQIAAEMADLNDKSARATYRPLPPSEFLQATGKKANSSFARGNYLLNH